MADVIVAGSGEACIHPLAMAAFCQVIIILKWIVRGS